MNNEGRTQEYRNYIENFLGNIYPEFRSEPQTLLFDAMEYSLLAGGKRLRPVFAMDFCRMCGGDWKDAAHFAAAPKYQKPPPESGGIWCVLCVFRREKLHRGCPLC